MVASSHVIFGVYPRIIWTLEGKKMAGVAGFEPAADRLTVDCSTAELHPKGWWANRLYLPTVNPRYWFSTLASQPHSGGRHV